MIGQIRPLRPEDLLYLPGLLSILDREPLPWDADFLEHKILRDPDFDPTLSPVIEVEGRPVAMAHGVTRDSETVFLKVVAVEPAFQRQGFATRLLDAFEARARERGVCQVRIQFSPPAYLMPGVDIRYTAAIHLLLRRGYETDRRSIVNMAVDLDSTRLNTEMDEVRLAALDINVLRARPQDRERAADLAQQIGSLGWRAEVLDAFTYDPIRLHVAECAGRIVAFAAQDVVGLALFGPTGTDPSYRRLGIGTVLLKRCLRDILARGQRRAEIVAAGPLAYYVHAVEARISRVFWSFEKSLRLVPLE